MTYLDTSALVKRFVVEKGTPLVQVLVARKGPVATAKVAYVEIYAGLRRKRREGGLSEGRYATACRQFERDWESYVRVDLRDEILLLARDLIQRHPLRGFDAIHLGSALSLQDALGEDVVFAAADARLLQAAEAERLQVIDVESASQLP
ncbi:MAG: type II toxin-antitoxin system VapC family toxin [Armatimonadota bacterium]|nr:type II toxin-antitoxin system VapC family toxin [Armatimonadota bacterium]MDR7518712.1 type II toxin-antitoxin system VapC family toxin [Armatimonadota bacterium]MDR7550032.1 type II toxin-antitoxin system VapC family toxin [Armatimonadota bacterium]